MMFLFSSVGRQAKSGSYKTSAFSFRHFVSRFFVKGHGMRREDETEGMRSRAVASRDDKVSACTAPLSS